MAKLDDKALEKLIREVLNEQQSQKILYVAKKPLEISKDGIEDMLNDLKDQGYEYELADEASLSQEARWLKLIPKQGPALDLALKGENQLGPIGFQHNVMSKLIYQLGFVKLKLASDSGRPVQYTDDPPKPLKSKGGAFPDFRAWMSSFIHDEFDVAKHIFNAIF